MTRCIIELKQYDVMPPHLLYFNLPDKSLPRLMTKGKSLEGLVYKGKINFSLDLYFVRELNLQYAIFVRAQRISKYESRKG